MEEVSFSEWWKSKEDEILNRFPRWSDVEEIKKFCLDCWVTQNTNCEIKIAQLGDDYDDTSFDDYDEDDAFFDER